MGHQLGRQLGYQLSTMASEMYPEDLYQAIVKTLTDHWSELPVLPEEGAPLAAQLVLEAIYPDCLVISGGDPKTVRSELLEYARQERALADRAISFLSNHPHCTLEGCPDCTVQRGLVREWRERRSK